MVQSMASGQLAFPEGKLKRKKGSGWGKKAARNDNIVLLSIYVLKEEHKPILCMEVAVGY